MKKLLVIALLVAALTAVFAASAFAADTPTPTVPVQGAGYGPGNAGRGIHTPGTGLVPGGAQGLRRGAPEWAGNNETAASTLGLTVEQLQAERLAGKSLVQIAASKGITEDALIAKLLEARKITVAQFLAEGKITQAQADYMTANMAEHVKIMVERTNVGRAPFAGQSPTVGTGRARGWNK